MILLKQNKLFGSRRRTEVILLLELMEESYATELARLLDAQLYTVQSIVDALEKEGIVVTRVIGRERRITLNPRLAWGRELRALARRIAEGEKWLLEILAKRRARPRRKGKAI